MDLREDGTGGRDDRWSETPEVTVWLVDVESNSWAFACQPTGWRYSDQMSGDADATRARILAAAVEEFSRYGMAGARVDRISAAARCNKAMIYAYYGSKDGLFEAVFDAVVVATVNDVPLDVDDLPGYAGRLFDQHRSRPEPLRVGYWNWLERGTGATGSPAVSAAVREKVEAIAGAQDRGQISKSWPAAILLDLVVALSRAGVTDTAPISDRARRAQRHAVQEAVALLTRP